MPSGSAADTAMGIITSAVAVLEFSCPTPPSVAYAGVAA